MSPILLSTPFASSGDKNTIPESDAPQPQNATWEKGFPPLTQTPISEGGVPPERNDFNGALNAITQNIVFQTQGGRYKFDPTYANKIGGYPVNAILQLENGTEVINKTPNNTTNPNVDMAGWAEVGGGIKVVESVADMLAIKNPKDGDVVFVRAESELYTYQLLSNKWQSNAVSSVVIDARKFGMLDSNDIDQKEAVIRCNTYVNSLPVSKGVPVCLRLPSGVIKSSVGFAFDREAFLIADGDSLFDYTGTDYAVRLGKLGETSSVNDLLYFGIKGVNLTGATNAKHGVYVAQYVLAPTFDSVYFKDFGNPNNQESYCVFLQGHNWDIYFRNCKCHWTEKNKVNLIRANGVLLDGTPDYGNSRVNIIDSFFNQGGNDCAGVGLFMNCFKGRVIGGGFQGFKTHIQFGRYAQNPEINGTYFESIYKNCESIFKVGEDGYLEDVVFSDLNLDNIYANLHNENNEFGDTDVKFLTTADNVVLSNLNIGKIKTLNGSKYPLLSLQEKSGQTCTVGDISHNNPLLHNIRDDQMVVVNTAPNTIVNSEPSIWQRGAEFEFARGVLQLADGFSLVSDGTTGLARVYKQPTTVDTAFPSSASSYMRIVRTEETNATYLNLRIRIGDIQTLAGQPATFSFVGRLDTDAKLTCTLVQSYSATDKVYKSFGSVDMNLSYVEKVYALSGSVPELDRTKTITRESELYLDLTLPKTTSILDIGCFVLQSGVVRTGWEFTPHNKVLEHAKMWYRKGVFRINQSGFLASSVNFTPMLRQPHVSATVVYQDGEPTYTPAISEISATGFYLQLNKRSTDVVVDWVADLDAI